MLWPATAAVPCPMTRDARDRAGSESGGDVSGECPLADIGAKAAVAFDDLAAQRLGEALRGLGDLLQEEVRGVAAIDVAGGHLGGGHVGGGDRDLGPVVGETHDAIEFAAVCAVEHHDLAAVFTIHSDIARRLLDDAIGLAGHDVAIVGEADVEPLSAASQRKKQLRRSLGAGDADGDRSFELDDGASERLGKPGGGGVTCNERGDHLRVGGDGRRDAQAVLRTQVGVVVDVTVQSCHHVGRLLAAGLFEFERVERVGVRFADDADAGPARVAEQRHPGSGRLQRPTQERVGAQRQTECSSVVAEFADLGGRLVDERQTSSGIDDGTGLEQRVGATFGDQCAKSFGFDIVAPHEHVESGRVAPAHLETVDRRERLLYCEVATER